jgi:hypothetical protein
MAAKIWKTLFVLMVLGIYATMRPGVCEAWSLWPFSSGDSAKAKAEKPAPKASQQKPSTWSKVTSAPKNFFNKTGETLGLKKPEKKQAPSFAYAKPYVSQKKKPESKSWFGSLFASKEPKKDKSVSDWMGSTKQATP